MPKSIEEHRPARSGRLRAARDTLILLAGGAAMLHLPPEILGEGLASRFSLPVRTFAVLALLTLLLHRAGEGWGSLGLRWPASAWRSLWVLLGGYALIASVGTLLIVLIFPALGWTGETPGAYAHLRGNTPEYLYWLAIAWTCAAIGEELIFRGFLFTRLERLFGGGRGAIAVAMVVQAAIFGMSHAYQGVSGIVLTGVTGFILCGVYLMSRRNLVVCILLHGLVDTISLSAIYSGVL